MNVEQKDALKWLLDKPAPSSASDMISQLLLKKVDNSEYGELSYDERTQIKGLYENATCPRVIRLDSARVPNLQQIKLLLNGWAMT